MTFGTTYINTCLIIITESMIFQLQFLDMLVIKISQRVTHVTCMENGCYLELPTNTRWKHKKTISNAAWAME